MEESLLALPEILKWGITYLKLISSEMFQMTMNVVKAFKITFPEFKKDNMRNILG